MNYDQDIEVIVETKRLYLRKLTQEDFCDLCLILQDEEVMYAYEHAFDDEEVQVWLDRQLYRYAHDGIGLWGVILKDQNKLIGQCGLTIQSIGKENVTEVGYLFQKEYWHQGYATEAARACKQYAFEQLHVKEVYSIIRDTNIASQYVAKRNGMHIVGGITKYYYGLALPHVLYRITNLEYEAQSTIVPE